MKYRRPLIAVTLAAATLGAFSLSARAAAESEYTTAELQPMSDPSEDPLLARMRNLFEKGFNTPRSSDAILKSARYACASRSTRLGDFQLDDSFYFLVDIIPGAYQMMGEEAVATVFHAQQSGDSVIYGRTELVANAVRPNTFDTILIASAELVTPDASQRVTQTNLQRTGTAAALDEDMFVIEWLASDQEGNPPVIEAAPNSEKSKLESRESEISVTLIPPFTLAAISNPEAKVVAYTYCAAVPEEKKEVLKKATPKASTEELEVLKQWTN